MQLNTRIILYHTNQLVLAQPGNTGLTLATHLDRYSYVYCTEVETGLVGEGCKIE